MARPLQSRKQSVDLASSPGPRVSKIRRDPPPPPEKPKALRHPDEVNRAAVVIGVAAFALAMVVLIFAFGSYSGWSPKEYRLELHSSE